MRVALCYNAPDAMQMLFTFKAFAMAQLGIQLTQSRWRRFHGTTAFRWLAGAKWSASPLELAARADFPSRVVALLREGLWTKCCLLLNPTLIPPPPLALLRRGVCAADACHARPTGLACGQLGTGSGPAQQQRRPANSRDYSPDPGGGTDALAPCHPPPLPAQLPAHDGGGAGCAAASQLQPGPAATATGAVVPHPLLCAALGQSRAVAICILWRLRVGACPQRCGRSCSASWRAADIIINVLETPEGRVEDPNTKGKKICLFAGGLGVGDGKKLVLMPCCHGRGGWSGCCWPRQRTQRQTLTTP